MSVKVTETEVLIIGGGIIGAAIARELSKFKVDVCLVEKEPAIGFGITKGSQGMLHSGLGMYASRLIKWFDRSIDVNTYLRTPLHVKEKFNITGYRMLLELEPFLKAKILKCGRIMLAKNEDDIKVLEVIKEVTESIGFKDLVLLDRNKLQDMEPALDYSRFLAGLYDPGEYTIFPTEWAIAFAENAKENGAHIVLDTEVIGIEERKGYYLIETDNGSIKAEFVINAAGLFSDEIANMVERIDWSFMLLKCEYLVLENRGYLSHIISEIPEPMKARPMLPTPEGNILVSGTIAASTDKYDLSTTKEALEIISGIPQDYVPGISLKKDIIRSYAAYMHFNTRDPDDYLIEWYRDRFLNLIVCPPGLAPAPALSQEVVKMLGDKGLDLVEKSDFNPYRDTEPRFIQLSIEEKNEKIRSNPVYGHIICRCEKACEQEVREAVRRGAITLDEIKFKTRTGMGRCQGGFCTSRVLKIMSEELGISPLEIKQKGGNSYILKSKTKEPRAIL